jgi:hypothetical protein
MDQLMRQNGADYSWSDDVLDFATRLGENYSDGHVERLLQVFATPFMPRQFTLTLTCVLFAAPTAAV